MTRTLGFTLAALAATYLLLFALQGAMAYERSAWGGSSRMTSMSSTLEGSRTSNLGRRDYPGTGWTAGNTGVGICGCH